MSEPYIPSGERLFQIKESDLAELEHVLPEIVSAMMGLMNDNRLKVQWRKVQEIIKNVRWNYGPPEEVIVIPDSER